MKLKKIAALLAIAGISAPAFATNGLNMEGYGPIATSMGGASMAHDNGTAGLINNPATLGLMKSGSSRLDLAIGGLHPDVTASVTGAGSSASGGTAYYMPAAGYVRKDGNVTWGIGMMSQGGMGTEFSGTSVLSSGGQQSAALGGAAFGPTGLGQRSELGLGRVMVPLTFDVSNSFRVGGTVDYLWGGMDMNMQLDGATFDAMGANFGNSNKRAVGFVGAKTNAAMNGALGFGFNYGYFNFSEGTDHFKQKLSTSGFAWNLGFVWQATPALSVGGVYHARTNLRDMSGSGQMVIGNLGGGGAAVQTALGGTLKVVNFQWPETYGIGVAYQASDKWQFVADYKHIAWSSTFQNMTMVFSANNGAVGEFGLNLNWNDQDVFQFGAAYKMDDKTTLRFGASLGNQMVTARNLIPVFPAVTTNHLTVGAGYALSKSSSFDMSLAFAPRVSVGNGPVATSMSQTNWQVMYSNRF